MTNYCFTLAYNLVSEVERTVKLLYEQNKREDFVHYLIDLEFPLLEGDKIPEDIEQAKVLNTVKLKILAEKYGSIYLKLPNVGVSQNWEAVYNRIRPTDDDFLTCACPDEIPIESGWVKACADVMKADPSVMYVAPMLTDHQERLKTNKYANLQNIGGHEVYIMSGNTNYGLVSIACKYINSMGGVPVPKTMEVYGGLEAEIFKELPKVKGRWGILRDFTQQHTNNTKLYRAWKDAIIFGEYKFKQIGFEQYICTLKEKS